MATSGTMNGNAVNIGGNGGNYYFINWQLASQNIGSNSSTINWQAYMHYNSADAQLDNGIASLSGTRWSNGGRVYNFASNFSTRNLAVASGSFTIGHNSDGTQSLSVSGGIDVYQVGRSSGSASWALTTIPRNSQVTTNASSYTLGDPITVNTNRKSTSFTHTITIRKDNAAGTVLKTFNSVGSSVTWIPSAGEITTMQGLIPNSNTLTVYVNQYNNQVAASSNTTVAFNLTAANPTFSDFTFKDTNASTVAITGSDQVLVKGKSTLEVEISSANKMVANKSSTPDRYDIVYEATTAELAYSASTITEDFTTVDTIGSRTIVARAYDSRNNSTTVAKNVTVYDYNDPVLEVSVEREDNFGANTTITTAGTFDLLPIGGVNKNAITASSLRYRVKQTTTETWDAWATIPFTVTDNTFSGTDQLKVLDNSNSYNLEFEIVDKFGTTTQAATLGAGTPILFIGEDGTVLVNGDPIGGGGGGSGDMLASTYDPNGVEGDAFDMDNMTAGSVNKNFTSTEKTKLSGIATGANVGVVPNTSITGSTKTKVTYDAKGLVTAGADATTADIADSTNKRYITDAKLTVLNNTTGTNTGDQTTITGNAGTATKLLTARTINGTSFDGTANITIADSTKVPTTRTVNGKALSSNITLTETDILPQTGNNGKYLTTNGTSSSWGSLAGGGDMSASTYDAAGISQQVVGTTATQTLTNKDLSSGTNTFPTNLDSNYSTSEVATTAKWVDGKTIYKKTIPTGSLPSSVGNKTVSHGISGLSTVVSLSGSVNSGTTFFTLPSVRVESTAAETNGIGMYADGTNIIIEVGINRSTYSGYVTIEYTKT